MWTDRPSRDGRVRSGVRGWTDSPQDSAGPRDRSGRSRDTAHRLPCAAKGQPKISLPGEWGGAAPPVPAAAELPTAPALPLGSLCTVTAGRGALPGLGSDMRETRCFQVNHPCFKRRDQSCARATRKMQAPGEVASHPNHRIFTLSSVCKAEGGGR